MSMGKLITGGVGGNGGLSSTIEAFGDLSKQQQLATLAMGKFSEKESEAIAKALGLTGATTGQAAAQTGATAATTGGAMAQTGLTTAQTAGTASTIGLTGALKTLWATMLSNPILLITMALTVGIVA